MSELPWEDYHKFFDKYWQTISRAQNLIYDRETTSYKYEMYKKVRYDNKKWQQFKTAVKALSRLLYYCTTQELHYLLKTDDGKSIVLGYLRLCLWRWPDTAPTISSIENEMGMAMQLARESCERPGG